MNFLNWESIVPEVPRILEGVGGVGGGCCWIFGWFLVDFVGGSPIGPFKASIGPYWRPIVTPRFLGAQTVPTIRALSWIPSSNRHSLDRSG